MERACRFWLILSSFALLDEGLHTVSGLDFEWKSNRVKNRDQARVGSGAAGATIHGVIPNVRSNDGVNGALASAANSTIAQVSSTSPGSTLNTTTDAVDVVASEPAGTPRPSSIGCAISRR